ALHSLARRGIEIERKAVNVSIHELDAVSIEPFILRVKCSAGTYVRTLAEEIGRAVGLGAHLTELRRVGSGRFGIDSSIGLCALESDKDPAAHLTPLSNAVAHLKRFTLAEYRVSATRSGLSSNVEAVSFDDGEFVAMFTEADELIAVGRFSAEN